MGLSKIAVRSRELAGRCRDGSVTLPSWAGGTFTVSNLGMFGVDEFTAIINSLRRRSWRSADVGDDVVVRDGEVTVAKKLRMTLSSDHRIVYGADAAAFLGDVRELLEKPLSLLL